MDLPVDRDLYADWGLTPDADRATIEATRTEAVKTLHPDKDPGASDARKRFLTKQFQRAQADFEILLDPEKRRVYDAARESQEDRVRSERQREAERQRRAQQAQADQASQQRYRDAFGGATAGAGASGAPGGGAAQSNAGWAGAAGSWRTGSNPHAGPSAGSGSGPSPSPSATAPASGAAVTPPPPIGLRGRFAQATRHMSVNDGANLAIGAIPLIGGALLGATDTEATTAFLLLAVPLGIAVYVSTRGQETLFSSGIRGIAAAGIGMAVYDHEGGAITLAVLFFLIALVAAMGDSSGRFDWKTGAARWLFALAFTGGTLGWLIYWVDLGDEVEREQQRQERQERQARQERAAERADQ